MRVERVPFRLISAATAAIILAACGQKQSAPPPQTPEVGVITVQPTSVPVTADLPGRTNSFLNAQVRARVDGIVLRRDFIEGSDVKAGQRLYKIDPAPYIAALNNAKASLAKAQANVVTHERAGRALQGARRGERGQQAGLRQRRRRARPGGRGCRRRQGRRRYRADQPRLYGRRLADHRPHRPLASDAGRLRAGERGDAADHRAATRSGVRGPDAIERRWPEAAPRDPGRAPADQRHRTRRRSRSCSKTAACIRKPASSSSPT